jgi:hypothetical protein
MLYSIFLIHKVGFIRMAGDDMILLHMYVFRLSEKSVYLVRTVLQTLASKPGHSVHIVIYSVREKIMHKIAIRI